MELLYAAVGLGIAGIALALQSKSPLPSEADFKKAQDKLATDPGDPDANTVVGKYLAFVLGDYDQAMLFLAKSGDKTLKTLAEHERAPLYADTAVKKVGMGDEWVTAAKSFPALFRIFYDRASHWYTAAWPDLDGPWKDKTRERGHKLAASRPVGAARNTLPGGWQAGTWPGGRPPIVDGTIAHVGSYSIKLLPADEKIKNSGSLLVSDFIPVTGKFIEISAYVFTDGTENGADQIRVDFFDAAGKYLGPVGPFVPLDLPFWSRVYVKVAIPENAARAQVALLMVSKKGTMWVDDVSIKVDGKEVIKNPSFENK